MGCFLSVYLQIKSVSARYLAFNFELYSFVFLQHKIRLLCCKCFFGGWNSNLGWLDWISVSVGVRPRNSMHASCLANTVFGFDVPLSLIKTLGTGMAWAWICDLWPLWLSDSQTTWQQLILYVHISRIVKTLVNYSETAS